MTGRVLVTGGAGFIGCRLVNELVRQAWRSTSSTTLALDMPPRQPDRGEPEGRRARDRRDRLRYRGLPLHETMLR